MRDKNYEKTSSENIFDFKRSIKYKVNNFISFEMKMKIDEFIKDKEHSIGTADLNNG